MTTPAPLGSSIASGSNTLAGPNTVAVPFGFCPTGMMQRVAQVTATGGIPVNSANGTVSLSFFTPRWNGQATGSVPQGAQYLFIFAYAIYQITTGTSNFSGSMSVVVNDNTGTSVAPAQTVAVAFVPSGITPAVPVVLSGFAVVPWPDPAASGLGVSYAAVLTTTPDTALSVGPVSGVPFNTSLVVFAA